VIEAGFAGVPVAGYALAGVPEAVRSGETGLLVPPGEADALAAVVAALLADADLRRRLGTAAAELCRERFAIGRVALRYLKLYAAVARATERPAGKRVRG
jgi:glycosyltransferase involved in cell wall biosynthesis